MSKDIRNLEPKEIWNHFADLNAIPRPSKKETRVIRFAKEFGEKLGLQTAVDETGNVIIRKPASPGMENRTPVLMQGHLDMVHQKNASTDFNFDSQGIEMFVDGDWVRAKGTTLGSDNGIGVASIMSVLASSTIAHPSLEVLFTVDEETGMTGASGLKGGLFEAGIMLNLDTEEDNELTIGCAGGVDVTATGEYKAEKPLNAGKAFLVKVKGLTGGHSGIDIHLGRANANKLMNRILLSGSGKCGLQVSSIDGGSLRNAIPRESSSLVVVPASMSGVFSKLIADCNEIFSREYRTTDPLLAVALEDAPLPTDVLAKQFQDSVLRSIHACPNGIYRMSPDIKDLVQTSNNLARVLIAGGEYSIQCLTRSSVDSEKTDHAGSIGSLFEIIGASMEFGGAYPGWTPRPEAKIVRLMSELYQKKFGSAPHVAACHAGLECGIIGKNYPEMEMISFGPNIRGAHSPDEAVQISSVQKFWSFLLDTLKAIPERNLSFPK